MNDDRHETTLTDAQLAELLELGDGPRPLPDGEEDRLLAEVLATATHPHATPVVDGRSAEVVTLQVHDRSSARWWPRTALLATTAACVLVVALVVVALQVRPATQPVGGSGATTDPAECARVAALVVALDVTGPTPRIDDVAGLRDLADLLVRLEPPPGGDVADEDLRSAAAALRLAASSVEEGRRAAAARSVGRAGALLAPAVPVGDELGC